MINEISFLKTRMTAQEMNQSILYSYLDELAEDMEASFRQQGNYQIYFEKKVDEQFKAIDRRFDLVDKRFEEVDKRFNAIDKRFEEVDQRFDLVDKRFEEVDQRFDKVEARLDRVEADIATIKATMATKDDLAGLEGRVLGAFQQLLTTIDQRLPAPDGARKIDA